VSTRIGIASLHDVGIKLMNCWAFLTIVVLSLNCISCRVALAAACNTANRAFVCGVTNPEDIVHVPGTPWIIASDLQLPTSENGPFGFGPLSAIEMNTHEVRRLYPSIGASVDWDQTTYPNCPAPPVNLSSHGLNVRPLSAKNFRIYVVNHGGRESIEIIDVEVRRENLVPTWRGCVVLPDGKAANAVVPLGGDSMAVSVWGKGAAIWTSGAGWKDVDGVSGNADGIGVSRDGKFLFVTLYLERQIARASVDGRAVPLVFLVDLYPDNLRWGENGRLYVTGHPDVDHWEDCLRAEVTICDGGFIVAQINPDAATSEVVYHSDGIKGAFGVASTALQIGSHIWLSSFIADRLAILDIKLFKDAIMQSQTTARVVTP
jgi:hypothetical protein